jgi:hypothetical protein
MQCSDRPEIIAMDAGYIQLVRNPRSGFVNSPSVSDSGILRVFRFIKTSKNKYMERKHGNWVGGRASRTRNKRADRILNFQIVAKYMYAIFKIFVPVFRLQRQMWIVEIRENAGSVQGWRWEKPLLKSDGHLSFFFSFLFFFFFIFPCNNLASSSSS